MKVALDESREQLQAEREQAARITRLLADAVAALTAQQALTQRADDLSTGYSEALTNLLTPADASGLDLR